MCFSAWRPHWGTTRVAVYPVFCSRLYNMLLLLRTMMAIIRSQTYSDVLYYAVYRCVICIYKLLFLRWECCMILEWPTVLLTSQHIQLPSSRWWTMTQPILVSIKTLTRSYCSILTQARIFSDVCIHYGALSCRPLQNTSKYYNENCIFILRIFYS